MHSPALKIFVACLLLAGSAQAAQPVDPRAVDDAVEALCRQIEAQPLGRRMTVGEYLRVMIKRDAFKELLRGAELVGGSRSVPGEATEVRLDISGHRVADFLMRIAADKPLQSPYTADFVASEVRVWSWRTFTSVGVGGEVPAGVAPTGVNPSAATPSSPPPAVVEVAPVNPPATIPTAPTSPLAPLTVQLDPYHPPKWVLQDFDTEAAAVWAGSQSDTAHHAERLAREKLAVELGKLEVVPGTTLMRLGTLDRRVESLLNESAGSAKLYQIEYLGDGSAIVKVSADTRRLWQNLLLLR